MVGQHIGNYRVVRKLGEGGMGAVFEAVHERIGRRAAVKVLHPQLSQNPEIANRFLNEARAVNIIQHQGLVGIFEYGRLPDGTVFIIMEYLEGEALSARLGRGRLPHADMLRLSRQIASALAAAHQKAIVHRDLKPDNVMIIPDPEAAGGERAKILDFGIAKVAVENQAAGEQVKTRTGMLMGTPSYMSPEQCHGAGGVTDRSDVYSLGVMLYEMLAGRLPFVAEGMGTVMAMHIYEAPRPLRELDPAIPEAMAGLVHGMLAKDPATRPPMTAVVAELERLGAARTGAMSPAPPDAAVTLVAGAAAVPVGAVASVPPVSHGGTAVLPDSQVGGASVPPGPVSPPSLTPVAHPSTLREAVGQRSTSPLEVEAPLGPRPRWPKFALVAGLGVAVLVGGIVLQQRSRTLEHHTLRVQKTGPGAIISEPAGIYCGTLCAFDFPPGAMVKLSVRPEERSSFSGWSGACTGAGACGIYMNKPTEVSAGFTAAAAGPGKGCAAGAFCAIDPRPQNKTLLRVWGTSPRDMWAVGYGGTILHYDGQAWSATPSGTTVVLRGVWGPGHGAGKGVVWAVGDRGAILRYGGTAWLAVPTGITANLQGVWGSGPADVWAVGDQGTILHFDGAAWAPVPSKTKKALSAVFAGGPDEAWAVGQGGTILRFGRKGWAPVPNRVKKSLSAVFASGPEVWAVGQAGTILRFDKEGRGKEFASVPSGTVNLLQGVFAAGQTVFVVGDYGTILHLAGEGGGSFLKVPSGTSSELMGIFGRSGEHFAVGSQGTILHHEAPGKQGS